MGVFCGAGTNGGWYSGTVGDEHSGGELLVYEGGVGGG